MGQDLQYDSGGQPRNDAMPGNPRYQPKQLIPYFGYDNLFGYVAKVEIATLRTLHDIGVIPDSEIARLDEVEQEILAIPTTQVDEVERKVTQHDIRAWVHIAQNIIDGKLGRWVHIPLTSYDPLETGRALQYTRAYREALNPSIARVVQHLSELVRIYADQIQIGRTHGQHALPITVGFWLATILQRILYNWEQMDTNSKTLRGKISGAVGAHNAQIGLGFNHLCPKGRTFEELVLQRLNLQPAEISTQILPPEPLAYFLHSCAMMSATFAQFGRDCRHLMRSEVGEIAESFAKDQTGSSTMAHKRNPINFENLEGTWLKTKNELGKVLDTLISEHQRDLVGSSIARDFPIILINLQHQLNTLLRPDKKTKVPFIARITINRDVCQRNFKTSSDVILAEPMYIALQMTGYSGDAHKLANHTLVPIAQAEGIPLIDALIQYAVDSDDTNLQGAIEAIPSQVMELLHHPERYTGDAEEQALKIADFADDKVKQLALVQ